MSLALLRPQPTETFTAWRVLGNGKAQPLDVSTATSLADIKSALAILCDHKQHVMVRHGNAGTGRCMLHTFVMKPGTPRYEPKPGYAHPVRVPTFKADLLLSVEVRAFEPVPVWVWTPGADVVGIDRTLVEG